MNATPYICTSQLCENEPLVASEGDLVCANGHLHPCVKKNNQIIPVFVSDTGNAAEYEIDNAAEIHDNALRWVFTTFGTNEDAVRKDLAQRLSPQANTKILITGAGACNDLPYIVEAMGNQGEIHLQDISQHMLLSGFQRYQSLLDNPELKIYYSVSDATNLPYQENYFDMAYHFGGINLYPSIKAGISEMNRVVRAGGKVLFGDEGMAPWVKSSEIGKMLINNNPLYQFNPPLEHLPETATLVNINWILSNCFYVIDFVVGDRSPAIDIDIPHLGVRGGTVRKRYFGRLEGIDPALKEEIYKQAETSNLSRVDYIEALLRNALECEEEG